MLQANNKMLQDLQQQGSSPFTLNAKDRATQLLTLDPGDCFTIPLAYFGASNSLPRPDQTTETLKNIYVYEGEAFFKCNGGQPVLQSIKRRGVYDITPKLKKDPLFIDRFSAGPANPAEYRQSYDVRQLGVEKSVVMDNEMSRLTLKWEGAKTIFTSLQRDRLPVLTNGGGKGGPDWSKWTPGRPESNPSEVGTLKNRGVTAVYEINTAGGIATPEDCQGRQYMVKKPYASQLWIMGNPKVPGLMGKKDTPKSVCTAHRGSGRRPDVGALAQRGGGRQGGGGGDPQPKANVKGTAAEMIIA
ncbi:MAG: hypothetical protein M1823_004616 [Watsoniomyces obsoletus]|nr:MAG: hypothetical protein M1823_004616 [Watsoniomyces obsoletus]